MFVFQPLPSTNQRARNCSVIVKKIEGHGKLLSICFLQQHWHLTLILSKLGDEKKTKGSALYAQLVESPSNSSLSLVETATKDERLQPWYIASILRPKNVVILFDISYSMTEDNKIIFARTAITPVLKGLLPTDFVNVSLTRVLWVQNKSTKTIKESWTSRDNWEIV